MAMPDDNNHFQDEINSFIRDLQSNHIKKSTKSSLLHIRSIIKQIGLNSNQITEIINFLPKGKLQTPKNLLSLLIPNDTINAKSVITIIFWFNSLSVQIADQLDTMISIIDWIILVYPYIENRYKLNAYYDLIMHYISSYYLCPHICHLLAFMTRGEDVTTFRVMKILRYNYNSLYLSTEFNGLLFLYKRLRSDFVNFNIGQQNNIVWFECPDPELQFDIYKVRMKHPNETTRSLSKGAIFARRPIDLLSKEDREEMTTKLYDIFNRETTQFEQPMLAQLTAMLFNKDHTAISMVLFWLDQAIAPITSKSNDPLANTVNRINWHMTPSLPFQIIYTISSLLQTLSAIAEFLNQSLPAIGLFVQHVLPVWIPHYPGDILFTALQQIDIATFIQLKTIISYNIVLINDERTHSFVFGLFEALGHLLNNWLFRMGTKTIASPDKMTNNYNISNDSCNPEDTLHLFDEFIKFAFAECYYCLSADNTVLETTVAAILLLDQIAQIPIRHKIALVYMPHTNLIYKLFVHQSPIVFNLTFRLLTHYFQAFEAIKSFAGKIYYSSEMQVLVEIFNNLILTISSKLQPSPLMATVKERQPFLLPNLVIKHFNIKKVENTFLLCNHLALAGFVSRYFELTQPTTSSKTTIYHPLSILEDKGQTQHFLNFLENHCRLTGLTSFLKIISKDTE
ncbi:hypothetical protein LOD99_7251 [Oopsacas minuta]|uniref:Centromere protein I n=1 Tax=Oopsacas minuta TaxID=111878 RepID=A0AAV7JUI6_9METZ|nr:hypothetical protein LOD99_7251 [Oopsacas minuta]